MSWDSIEKVAITFGAIVFGVGYAIAQFKGGYSKNSKELIEILQQKDEEQKELIIDYQGRFEKINKELGVLEGVNQEQAKKIEEYLAIFQGRSPEQNQYMKDMRDFTSGVAKYMAETTKTLTEMSLFMHELNEKFKIKEKSI